MATFCHSGTVLGQGKESALADSLIKAARQKVIEQEITEALVILERAIAVSKESGDIDHLVKAYLDKAEQQRAIGSPESLATLQKCEPYLKSVRDSSYRIFFYNRKSAILFEKKEHDASLAAVKQAQEASRKYSDFRYILSNLNLEGANLRELGRLDEAVEVFKKLREAALEKGDQDEYCLCLFNMTYTQIASKRKQEALRTIDEFLGTDCSGLRWMMSQEMVNHRAFLHKELGNFDSAYFYLEEALTRSMTRNAEINAEELADLALRLDLAEQNLENTRLQQDNKRKQLLGKFWLISSILLIGVLFVFITGWNRLKKLNRKLEQVNLELSQALMVKKKLLQIVAHDVRGPLVGITSMVNLYNEGKVDKENADEFLNKVEGSASEVNLLLESILNWVKSQDVQISADLKSVEVKRIFEELDRQSKAASQAKGVTVSFEYSQDHKSIKTDFDLLLLVLRNLVSNSIKFSKSGGQVNVSFSQTETHNTFKVSDDGVGMSASKVDQLLIEKSTSTRGTKGETGTGLGLQLCMEIARILGGEIQLKSTENVGTTVSLEFPK